jgi:MYXO-CTERM domain-containing protein
MQSHSPTTTAGPILMGMLAVAFALLVVRLRRRFGLASTSRTWAVLIAAFVVAILTLWAAAQPG